MGLFLIIDLQVYYQKQAYHASGSPTASPTSGAPTVWPTPPPTVPMMTVACGNFGFVDTCGGEDAASSPHAQHDVRCCGDFQLEAAWQLRGNCGGVWGGTKTGSGQCHAAKTFAEAKDA